MLVHSTSIITTEDVLTHSSLLEADSAPRTPPQTSDSDVVDDYDEWEADFAAAYEDSPLPCRGLPNDLESKIGRLSIMAASPMTPQSNGRLSDTDAERVPTPRAGASVDLASLLKLVVELRSTYDAQIHELTVRNQETLGALAAQESHSRALERHLHARTLEVAALRERLREQARQKTAGAAGRRCFCERVLQAPPANIQLEQQLHTSHQDHHQQHSPLSSPRRQQQQQPSQPPPQQLHLHQHQLQSLQYHQQQEPSPSLLSPRRESGGTADFRASRAQLFSCEAQQAAQHMFEEARAEASKMRAASHLESARQRAAWGANAGGGQDEQTTLEVDASIAPPPVSVAKPKVHAREMEAASLLSQKQLQATADALGMRRTRFR
uniref:Uncharacterized protein n=1 Tax=Chrysotila carterae TaxID=13221 RepID=A0A7S4BEZ4_CHRCT